MNILNYQETFKDFTGRDEALSKVVRYHSYKPMYYRSNLVTHSKHTLWLMQSLLPHIIAVLPDFDATRAQLMAAVHDDQEIIMGDVERGMKNKMSPQELAQLNKTEQEAITKTAARFPPTISGYNYADLIKEGAALKTKEAKLVKFVDRFDALGEALHEIFAGNCRFITPLVDPTYGIIDLPAPYYINYAADFLQKNTEFSPLFDQPHILFVKPTNPDYDQIVKSSAPHSPATITNKSGYPLYDFWKNIIFNSGDNQEIKNLYTQKEFLLEPH